MNQTFCSINQLLIYYAAINRKQTGQNSLEMITATQEIQQWGDQGSVSRLQPWVTVVETVQHEATECQTPVTFLFKILLRLTDTSYTQQPSVHMWCRLVLWHQTVAATASFSSLFSTYM